MITTYHYLLGVLGGTLTNTYINKYILEHITPYGVILNIETLETYSQSLKRKFEQTPMCWVSRDAQPIFYSNMKERITITIDKDLLDWIDEKVLHKVFANRSHGFEFLIMQHKLHEKNLKERGIT